MPATSRSTAATWSRWPRSSARRSGSSRSRPCATTTAACATRSSASTPRPRSCTPRRPTRSRRSSPRCSRRARSSTPSRSATSKLILRAGGTPDRIVFNGNSKTEEEVRFALDRHVAVINVDSLEEMQRSRPAAAHGDGAAAGLSAHRRRQHAVDRRGPGACQGRLAGQVRHGSGRRDGGRRDRARTPRPRARGPAQPPRLLRLRHAVLAAPRRVRHERCVEQTLDVARSIREEHGQRLAILNMGGGYRVGNPAGYGLVR